MNLSLFSRWWFWESLLCGMACASVISASRASADDAPPPPVSFSREIAPVLVKNCAACHGPREAKGNFQVSNYQILLKEGESGSPSITPGKPEESELFNLISSDDKDSRMPKDGDPLPAAQIALVKRWIMEGAKYDSPNPLAPLADIVPRLPQPDPPSAYRRPFPITALAFSANGQELAVGGYHEVTLWNPADGTLRRRIKNVAERTYGLSYSPDGTRLAVAAGTPGQLGEVKLFNPVDGALLSDLGSFSDVAFRAVFNPAGTKLATGGADRSIRIFDVASGKQERIIEDHADWVVGLAWSPDGTKLASASRDKTSKVFDAQSGDSISTYSGHADQVFGVYFGPEGRRVFSCGMDKKVHSWTPANGQKATDGGGFNREVFGMAGFDKLIFCCSGDGTVRQFHNDSLEGGPTYGGAKDVLYAVAYHDGTKRVAAAGFAGEVRVWNAEDSKLVTSFIAAPGYTPPTP